MSIPSSLYSLGWKAARPMLSRNQRLQRGWDERTLQTPLPQAQVWIQAASGGEAKLAGAIARALEDCGLRLNVLATTNTAQGRQVLDAESAGLTGSIRLLPRYCPLDDPSLMAEALKQVRPRVVVLLETELWPGLLQACQKAYVPVMVLNARMRPKSLARYLALGAFLPAPAEVQAVTPADAARYETLFGPRTTRVEVMDNIKFDLLAPGSEIPYAKNPLSTYLRPKTPFVVLGSMRRQEAADAAFMAASIMQARPRTVIGLFPRHMEHVDEFEAALVSFGLTVARRSALEDPAQPGSVVLWDEFGELAYAYHLARTAFIGGSLAPLGGQNILEPLAAGVVPASGPSLYNFAWVADDLAEAGLLHIAQDAHEAADLLIKGLASSRSNAAVLKKTHALLESRRGGAAHAADRIAKRLAKEYIPA